MIEGKYPGGMKRVMGGGNVRGEMSCSRGDLSLPK